MDLESIIDDLYGGSPEEFIERRTSYVAEARAARDRDLARAIGQLRRPTRSAWLVNLLARKAADEVHGLVDLGAALSAAQRQLSGPELRRLSSQRSAVLNALTRRAADLGVQHGHTATDATLQEVSSTLGAALADPTVAELVQAGRVAAPAAYGGFGPMDFPSTAHQQAAEVQTPASAEEVAPGGADEPSEQEDAGLAVLRETVRSATEALLQARDETVTAQAEAEAATGRADDLAEEVENLRARLREAEASARDAEEAARTARRRQQRLQEGLTLAEQAVDEACRALEARTSS